MSRQVPILKIASAMGHLEYLTPKPAWFDESVAFKYDDIIVTEYMNTDVGSLRFHNRAHKDPMYMLNTRHGQVLLDLSMLPYKAKYDHPLHLKKVPS